MDAPLHPLRLQYELFSDANPLIRPLAALAEAVRDNRQPVASDNLLPQAQEAVSEQIEQALDSYREVRDRACEELFHATYGSPLLQAVAGLKANEQSPRQRPGTDAAYLVAVSQRIADLKARINEGGCVRPRSRSALHPRGEGAADERGLAFLRRLRANMAAVYALAVQAAGS
jgi:hypothetical protein